MTSLFPVYPKQSPEDQDAQYIKNSVSSEQPIQLVNFSKIAHLVSHLASPTWEIPYQKPCPTVSAGIYEHKEALHNEPFYIS